ncbi:MAG: cysteine desulfurase NifS [Eubacteriales bacterium]|nr:cysteine desulfurase NifS [Eubacteriales bacterium]
MIYLDNAATTRMADAVWEEMHPFFREQYGNPSGMYRLAAKSKEAIAKARSRAASLIGSRADEIYFTSGGTESDNWALKAVFAEYNSEGKHIITTKIEHPAVLRTCAWLEKEHGAEVTYLDVDAEGRVDPEAVRQAIRPDTILISVMAANNEIGTIEPVKEIGQIAKEKGILFHTDAVQAFGQIPIDVDAMGIDLLSASGHKVNGPKGVGILYIRRSAKVSPLIHGGAQERNRRAGTENVPAIVGMGAAAALAGSKMHAKAEKETAARNYLIRRIREEIPYVKLNGPEENRLPNNVNVCIAFAQSESMLIMLDQKGICASGGSACATGSLEASHVLRAIGIPENHARSALRLTLSEENTEAELDSVVTELKGIVERLRKMSAKYEAFLAKEKSSNTSESWIQV